MLLAWVGSWPCLQILVHVGNGLRGTNTLAYLTTTSVINEKVINPFKSVIYEISKSVCPWQDFPA